ncbi:hypothetical protein Hypma_007333 [Hypsizygus marmoreus]|uniref:Uncharacterized protein n=1 Tax=Hypsizygus marmoreus TaxID=39966 RepID=A0A151V6T4_HYPMA|nr:hypothetical protein Hypma_003418 [Hypsizygus marmoreus]RDB30231.1 hypothetical protein Hypma_007333 [Hypsizygus marmoreus]
MDEISGSQAQLSEELLLLQELGYSDVYIVDDPPAPPGFKDIRRDPDTDTDLRVLDVIAACLNTGKPEDVVAAAFDKREQISLILAKSGDVDSSDYAATHAFLSALREAKNWTDLLPFLATHTKHNIERRVRRLNESITDLFDDLQSAATDYKFSAIENEFPRSGFYRRSRYPEGLPTPQRFLHELMRECVIQSTDFEIHGSESLDLQYPRLLFPADSLCRSSFFRHLTSKYYQGGDSKLKGRVEKLQRRLRRVCQYAKIDMLIRLVRRLPNIPFRWLENADTIVDAQERSPELCKDPMEVVERVLGRQPSPEQTDKFLRQYPDLSRNWERRRRLVKTRIHPELRIILELGPPLLSRLPQNPTPDDVVRLPIGCSKRSCLCCAIWIDLLSVVTTGLQCVTAGSNGKPCGDWELPCTTGGIKVVPEWLDLDMSVATGVNRRLERGLHSLMPPPPRILDEAELSALRARWEAAGGARTLPWEVYLAWSTPASR